MIGGIDMSIEIKQEKYFDLEIEVDESTVTIYQKEDIGTVISKEAAKQLIKILNDFID